MSSVIFLRMTALHMIIMGVHQTERYSAINITIMMFAAAILLIEPLLKDWRAWFSLLAALLVLLCTTWHDSENNRFLLIYWVLAITISLRQTNKDESFALNARLLIGLSFGAAFLHKLLLGDYLNGTFFEHTLLSDSRLKKVCILLAGHTKQTVIDHYKMIDILYLFPGSSIVAEFTSSVKLKAIAFFLSYWTLLIEFLIAFSFLAFPLKKISKMRDIFLMIFLSTTYLVTPVPRFAMVLATMGLAQTSESKLKRGLYIFLYFIQPFLLLMTSRVWSKI